MILIATWKWITITPIKIKKGMYAQGHVQPAYQEGKNTDAAAC